MQDMVVLVTGASGGIGRAVADAVAAEGARLVLHAGSQRAKLEAWMENRSWKDRALCLAADVRDPSAVDGLVDTAVERFGRLDVAVVNAGIWPPDDRPLHEMPIERVREVVDVNLLGAMWTTRSFLRALAAAGPRDDGRGASVCYVGSTAGRFGEAGHAEYATTKAALHGLVRSIKNEIVRLDPYGRVNMVEPGWTVTPMAKQALDDPETVPRVLSTIPIRQLARPEDIARAVVFLSAPALSRHVSGEILTVSGGMEGRLQWGQDAIDVDRVRARLEPGD